MYYLIPYNKSVVMGGVRKVHWRHARFKWEKLLPLQAW